jgi:hypothetical protein
LREKLGGAQEGVTTRKVKVGTDFRPRVLIDFDRKDFNREGRKEEPQRARRKPKKWTSRTISALLNGYQPSLVMDL